MRHQIGDRNPITAQNNALPLLLDRRHQSRKLSLGLIKVHRNHELKLESDQTRSSLSFNAFFASATFFYGKSRAFGGRRSVGAHFPARQRGPFF